MAFEEVAEFSFCFQVVYVPGVVVLNVMEFSFFRRQAPLVEVVLQPVGIAACTVYERCFCRCSFQVEHDVLKFDELIKSYWRQRRICWQCRVGCW